jgi:aminoglycoside phosphotransferase (APT) family kinase protein
MSDLRATATTLFTTCTGRPPSSIVEVVEGQNAVVVVGRDEVLRLPRTSDATARLDLTARLGYALGPRLPVPIPQPRVHWTEAGAISIERRLPGEPFSKAMVSELPRGTQRLLARQLFEFLHALHSIDLDALRAEVQLPVVNPRDEWNDLVRRARTALAVRWSATLEQRFLNEVAQFEATFDDDVGTTLRHGDFGGTNMLVDRDAAQMTGILDFELAAEGDPLYDYASASTLGTVIAEELFDAAGLSASQRRRVTSYRASFPLQEALFAVAAGDLDDVPRALAAYDVTGASLA